MTGAPVPPRKSVVIRLAATLLVIDVILVSGKRFSALNGLSSSHATVKLNVIKCTSTLKQLIYPMNNVEIRRRQ